MAFSVFCLGEGTALIYLGMLLQSGWSTQTEGRHFVFLVRLHESIRRDMIGYAVVQERKKRFSHFL